MLKELSERSATEGLALIRWNGIPIDVLTFDGASRIGWRTPFITSPEVRAPLPLRTAWFGTGGDVVAWNLVDRSQRRTCPSAIIVVSPRAVPWQLPGSIVTYSMGVSADGARVAFDGNYKPPGAMSLKGMFYADSSTGAVTRISESCGTTSISWSPDGGAFVYDCQNHVLIYDLKSTKSRLIATGSNPAWSPKWALDRLPFIVKPSGAD